MPRKESKAVPEGNDGPVPQQKEFGSGQPTLADVYRMFKEQFDRSDRYWYGMRSQLDQQVKKLDEMAKEMRLKDRRQESLEQDARRPRLAMEADGPPDTKTRECTEGAAKAVQAMHRVDSDLMRFASFGDDCTGLCSREDALVDNGAAVLKSCLTPLEMRTPTAAGGLLPTGEASILTRINYNQPPLRLYLTEETNSKKSNLRTPVLSVPYDCSFRRNKLLLSPPAGGSSRQNQDKRECLIQAVLKTIPAPAHFGERGARCFVVRLCVLERSVTICSFFKGSMIQGSETCR